MIRSFPPHPNPLPPGERVGHSSPQQSWGVFWHILINHQVNPVRNSSGALNPAGIILKSNPAAADGLEGLWPGGSSGALFLTG